MSTGRQHRAAGCCQLCHTHHRVNQLSTALSTPLVVLLQGLDLLDLRPRLVILQKAGAPLSERACALWWVLGPGHWNTYIIDHPSLKAHCGAVPASRRGFAAAVLLLLLLLRRHCGERLSPTCLKVIVFLAGLDARLERNLLLLLICLGRKPVQAVCAPHYNTVFAYFVVLLSIHLTPSSHNGLLQTVCDLTSAAAPLWLCALLLPTNIHAIHNSDLQLRLVLWFCC